MSWPSKRIAPRVGCSSRSTVRPSVDLPQPDSPTRPSVSPGAIASDTSCDDAEVVGDEQDAHAQLGLQPAHQLEDLRLDRHVERGGRLVGDQQVGLAGQRHRDHHALAHAARQLVRVVVDAALGRRDADLAPSISIARARASRARQRPGAGAAPRRSGRRR
jgi:hypothetical protein